MQAIVIFGSNSGDKFRTIENAIEILAGKTGEIKTASSFYETEPWGFDCDEQFLNKIVIFNTFLLPHDFLHQCLATETQLGRMRENGEARYQSRPIDIDILFYDDMIINSPELTIPHPRLEERNFVLIPLNEIIPGFEHPVSHKKIKTLLSECHDKLKVSKIDSKKK